MNNKKYVIIKKNLEEKVKTLELITLNPEEQTEVCELTRIPEILKGHSNSCFRGPFFSDGEKINCFGPMTVSFEIRTAKDLLLEGCEYQGLEIKLETGGHVLPALPAYSELEKLLDSLDTIVHINGHIYKPNSEVFGFQQVYDDAVKFIDNLKKLGFTNETMAIYATPNDITVEINGSAFGIEGNSELSSRYYKLLCYLAEIKEGNGKPQKTTIKTVLLNTVLPKSKILLPGSIHPIMKRVKVAVGASHFAYGIAAFSDTCGKKRTPDECIKEALNWLKFLEREQTPVSGIRELLDNLPRISQPNKASKITVAKSSTAQSTKDTPSSNTSKNFIGVFQSLKSELEAAKNDFINFTNGVPAFNVGLDKTLGKGWAIGGIHIILGNREKGKASLLLQQAIISENKMPVLYISFDQNIKNFVFNAASLIGGLNKSEILSALSGTNADKTKMILGTAIDKLQNKLSQNLFFSGVEAGRTKFDADEILELTTMLPEAPRKLVIIESVSEDDFKDSPNTQLQKLKSAALANNLTVLISIHVNEEISKHPNFIEDSDIDYLAKYQRFSDTIIDLVTDRSNLRKFVALVKGQVDTALVNSLEQKALQFSGGKRLKNDTYSFLRLIHNRNGKRDLMLFLYQPDMGKFFELATVPLARS